MEASLQLRGLSQIPKWRLKDNQKNAESLIALFQEGSNRTLTKLIIKSGVHYKIMIA